MAHKPARTVATVFAVASIFAPVLFFQTTFAATDASIKLKVNGVECVIDTLHAGVNLQYQISPDDCKQLTIPQLTPGIQPDTATPKLSRDENFPVSNTPIDGPHAVKPPVPELVIGTVVISPLATLATVVALMAVMTLAIDAIIYKSRYMGRAYSHLHHFFKRY